MNRYKNRTKKKPKKKFQKRQNSNGPVNQSGNIRLRRNPMFPGDIKMKPIQTCVIRYFMNAASTLRGITPASILASRLTVNPVNTNASPVFASIRIRRISMYFVPTGNFDVQGNSLAFRWLDQNLPDSLITDRGTLTEPSCIKEVPPPNSICAMWFRTDSPTIAIPFCSLSIPAGGIIDFEFQYIMAEGSGNTVYVLTVQPLFYGVTFTSILQGNFIPDGQVSTFITTI